MLQCYAWFPLDRNEIVKSCDPRKFWLTTRSFVRIYENSLSCYKSEPVSIRFLFSVLTNLSSALRCATVLSRCKVCSLGDMKA